jgi:hypothetical protein
MLGEERRRILELRRVVREHAPHEPLTQRLLVRRKSFGRAETVARETIGEHGEIVAVEASANRMQILGSDLQASRVVERQRRLAEDGRERRGLQHHREREVAGEAHPDRSDSGSATLVVREPRERAKPLRHGTRHAGAQGAELGTHARLAEDARALLRARHHAVATEERGEIDREACLPQPVTLHGAFLSLGQGRRCHARRAVGARAARNGSDRGRARGGRWVGDESVCAARRVCGADDVTAVAEARG